MTDFIKLEFFKFTFSRAKSVLNNFQFDEREHFDDYSYWCKGLTTKEKNMQNHHPLVAEFPDKKDAIHTLKMSNAHFRRLAFEYEGVDKAIVRIEQEITPTSDEYLNTLKKERLSLKDTLLGMLNNI